MSASDFAVRNNLQVLGTGFAQLPRGSVLQRPSSPVNGMTRYNSDANVQESYINGAWTTLTTQTDLAVIACRRTTTQALTTTVVDVTLDTIEYANQTTVLTRDAITSRIDILTSGVYLIALMGETINTTTANSDLFQVKRNGTAVSGGLVTVNSRSARAPFSRTIPLLCAAGDYISVGASSSAGTTGTLQIGMEIVVVRLQGAQGPTGPVGGTGSATFVAANLDNPNNSNWAVSTMAPVVADTANNSLLVRAFDDTAEEGVGFTMLVPSGATNITITPVYKNAASPVSSMGVVLRLYAREITIGSPIGAWSSALALSALATSTDLYYQQVSLTSSLSSLGIVASNMYQFQLTRYGAAAADTLVGDLHLLQLVVSFS